MLQNEHILFLFLLSWLKSCYFVVEKVLSKTKNIYSLRRVYVLNFGASEKYRFFILNLLFYKKMFYS